MSIIEELFLLSFVLCCSFAVVVAQIIQLARLLRSRAWRLIAAGILVIGLRQLWNLIRLPAAILTAKAKGAMPESLTLENWLAIGAAFLAVGLLIAGFDSLRRDLRKIGI